MEAGDLKIKMIYNNTGECSGMKNAWGLSIWIEDKRGATLFDTGGDTAVLKQNMEHLGLDFSKLDRIVISHNHWDHKGGLEYVLGKTKACIDMYVPIEVRKEYQKDYPGANVIGVNKSMNIHNNIWSTGSMSATHKGNAINEQSLIIKNNDSMILLNGCSHPGIVQIVKQARTDHPGLRFSLVAGGFHLMRKTKKEVREISAELKELGIDKIAPSHCTGEKAIDIFREDWGDKFVDMNIGDEKTA